MITRILPWLVAGLLVGLPASVRADPQTINLGGDMYVAGQSASPATPVAHDAFVAGYDVALSTPVGGDAHLAGYNVQSTSAIAGDLYAAGFSVTVSGSVEGDFTAIGNQVVLKTASPVAGNVRVAGGVVIIDAAVNGSVLATGRSVTINAPINGDLSFYGETLTFGPSAQVAGKVLIHAPKEFSVPTSVAPAARVVFALLTSPQYPSEAAQTAEAIAKSFWVTLWGAALWWLLLLVVGAAMISLNALLVDELSTLAAVKPARRIGLGLLAFAAMLGLVPLLALTLVGLLVLPFLLIFVAAACSAAYLAGVYLIGTAVGSRIVPLATRGRKIFALAVSLIVAGLLTLIPFIGWLVSLALVTFGFGVIAALLMASWGDADRARLAQAHRDAVPTVPPGVAQQG